MSKRFVRDFNRAQRLDAKAERLFNSTSSRKYRGQVTGKAVLKPGKRERNARIRTTRNRQDGIRTVRVIPRKR